MKKHGLIIAGEDLSSCEKKLDEFAKKNFGKYY